MSCRCLLPSLLSRVVPQCDVSLGNLEAPQACPEPLRTITSARPQSQRPIEVQRSGVSLRACCAVISKSPHRSCVSWFLPLFLPLFLLFLTILRDPPGPPCSRGFHAAALGIQGICCVREAGPQGSPDVSCEEVSVLHSSNDPGLSSYSFLVW